MDQHKRTQGRYDLFAMAAIGLFVAHAAGLLADLLVSHGLMPAIRSEDNSRFLLVFCAGVVGAGIAFVLTLIGRREVARAMNAKGPLDTSRARLAYAGAVLGLGGSSVLLVGAVVAAAYRGVAL